MSEIQPKQGSYSREINVATLNVNGLPSFRQNARTRELLLPYGLRHRELCAFIEASEIDIINLQEVFTHRDRRLFQSCLPSFKYISFAPSAAGPKGALVTFSRLPIDTISYESYASSTKLVDITRLARLSKVKSMMKGILVSRLSDYPLTVVNTHPLANDDWDWSLGNRFYGLHEAALGQLASTVRRNEEAVEDGVVFLGCDLNVAKDSELFRRFLGSVGLRDVFQGDVRPTFYEDFMSPEFRARCIDFLLVSRHVTATNPHRIVDGKIQVEGEGEVYLTDHLGLSATIKL